MLGKGKSLCFGQFWKIYLKIYFLLFLLSSSKDVFMLIEWVIEGVIVEVNCLIKYEIRNVKNENFSGLYQWKPF